MTAVTFQCEKRSFPTEQAALSEMHRARELRRTQGNPRIETRVYFCDQHQGWHLTSQSERNHRTDEQLNRPHYIEPATQRLNLPEWARCLAEENQT